MDVIGATFKWKLSGPALFFPFWHEPSNISEKDYSLSLDFKMKIMQNQTIEGFHQP
jgi:hypothetical protein